jgi:hypothetical protein
LREKDFFFASSSFQPFPPIFFFGGFYYLCDSFYLFATWKEVFLFGCICYFGNNERLGKNCMEKFKRLTLLYFMHGWNVQILISFGVEGGEDNMPPLLWQVLHVVVRALEVFLKGLHLPLVLVFLVFSRLPSFKAFFVPFVLRQYRWVSSKKYFFYMV